MEEKGENDIGISYFIKSLPSVIREPHRSGGIARVRGDEGH